MFRARFTVLLLAVCCAVAVKAAEPAKTVSPHWAYRNLVRSPLPRLRDGAWCRSPVDAFVLSRLEREKLRPSPSADRVALLRRVTFGLTGLPPTIDEVDAFLADNGPDVYERAVDRLLAAPRYGERMALHWLDLARYADTHGYHADTHRDMWRWRDWVIDAFNQGMPFDQFTIEQLAGDLLPSATLDQKIATGFHRNHMINFENGTIPEEYRTEYVADRTVTTSTVWLGQTLQCARCHDHKHDPLTSRDFYRLFAFFNNVPEAGLDGQKGNAAPFISAPTKLQQDAIERGARELGEVERKLNLLVARDDSGQANWEQQLVAGGGKLAELPRDTLMHLSFDEGMGDRVADVRGAVPPGTVHGDATWLKGKTGTALAFDGESHIAFGDICSLERSDPFSISLWVYPTEHDEMALVAKIDELAGQRGFDISLRNKRVHVRLAHDEQAAIDVAGQTALELNQWQHVLVLYNGGGRAAGVRVFFNGKPEPLTAAKDSLVGSIQNTQPLLIGRRGTWHGFRGLIDDVRVYRRELAADEAATLADRDPIREILATRVDRRSPAQSLALRRYYLERTSKDFQRLLRRVGELRQQLAEIQQSVPTTMVMQELEPPRETFVLLRGQYDQFGERVTSGTPATLLPPLAGRATWNRLDLARWLVSPDNPLTARVTVNRFWQLHFGTGLVATPDDFGTRGEAPSHPELLDWLAMEFRNSDCGIRIAESVKQPSLNPQSAIRDPQSFDVKRLHRLLVTSATYRQSSRLTPDLLQRDPHNRLVARGPRQRLPAEAIRDTALFTGGLLDSRIGGPSVFPYQPPGLWEEVAYDTKSFTAQTYTQSHGADLYRRSLYAFWKRAVPPPSLVTLDAPDREVCTVTRPRSNTPQQALVLMNDPCFVEAARGLAVRAMLDVANPDERLEYMVRCVTSRRPLASELRILSDLLHFQLTEFRNDPAATGKLLSDGESRAPQQLDPIALSALTTVASIILGLDEAIAIH